MILFDEPVGICSKGGKNMDDRMEREKIVRNFFFSRFFRLKKKKKKGNRRITKKVLRNYVLAVGRLDWRDVIKL